jgi:tyrosine-protein kinase Etk/Wzc
MDAPSLRELILAWVAELRRRWRLAGLAALAVLVPTGAFALFSVPTYTSVGVVQVSSDGAAVNPLLELAGAVAPSEVETEVEIIQRRELVLPVLKGLRLQLVDPHQPRLLTTGLDVVLDGHSPVDDRLRAARDAVERLEISPSLHDRVPLVVSGLPGGRVRVAVGEPETAREHEAAVGEPIVDEALVVRFRALPVPEGETIELEALGDGLLVETVAKRLRVASVGDARTATNLVEIQFTDPDREIAQAVVQALMQQYLDQSLRWQSLSASSSADFIAKRLEEARQQLASQEDTLREFAEQERAVQLDTQAEVTIRSSAELESDKRKIELQERVIGTVLAGLRHAAPGQANLTSNFFEDPVLAAAVGALTEAETEHEVLRATLTEDHPRIVVLGRQIARQQVEVRRLLRSAQRNLTQQRQELDARIARSMDSLSAYPEKELQLARHVRDVEVMQRLYSFLLEKYQEAQILEASTTIDKRIVDSATLPHRRTSPHRAKLLGGGLVGAFAFVLVVVHLAQLLQRRLQTVDALKEALPYPVYGSVPMIKTGKKGRSPEASRHISPSAIWLDGSSSAVESFRALAANVCLGPPVVGRGRIVQITSSQPGEGKSMMAANLGVALSASGGRVLLIDLDLRRPVQHRAWGLARAPGYGDLAAQGGDVERVLARLQRHDAHDVDVLTAGSKLPDPLGALMSTDLDAMLAQLSTRYDHIIIDSPPLFTADAAFIGRHVDLMVVVARPGVTERAAIRHALESLAHLGVHKALVLNGVGPEHTESYYYYYGGGYQP